MIIDDDEAGDMSLAVLPEMSGRLELRGAGHLRMHKRMSSHARLQVRPAADSDSDDDCATGRLRDGGAERDIARATLARSGVHHLIVEAQILLRCDVDDRAWLGSVVRVGLGLADAALGQRDTAKRARCVGELAAFLHTMSVLCVQDTAKAKAVFGVLWHPQR
nr:hypothetical protein HK105_007842 [Polyrhizophydium stewartii]